MTELDGQDCGGRLEDRMLLQLVQRIRNARIQAVWQGCRGVRPALSFCYVTR